MEIITKTRANFDKIIKINNLNLFTCPCCGLPTLESKNSYDICFICDWEDDGQDENNKFDVLGGPNGDLSLFEARKIILTKINYNKLIEKYLDDSFNNSIINKVEQILYYENKLDLNDAEAYKSKIYNIKNDLLNLIT